MATEKLTNERLTKKERNKLWNRYMWFNNGCTNFQNFYGNGWAWVLRPLFEKYYNKDGVIEGMQNHLDWYNCEAQTASVIAGVVVGMEEERAVTGKVSADVIRATKASLQGPVAGIGDSVVQGTLIPLLLGIGVSLTQSTGVLGPLFYIFSYLAIIVFGSHILFNQGYRLGRNAMATLTGGILYLEGTPTDLLLGHHAKTKEEFIQWNETRQFDKLFRFVDYVPGDFIHIPANTLHSFRIRGIMIAFARNSDVTLRLYDYDRMDPKTGKPRKMHVKEVYENVTIPDDQILPTRGRIVEQGALTHTVYYDAPGEYTAGRVQVKEKASFALDEFYFLFCVNGGGTVNGQRFQMGDVLFVPQKFGPIDLAGDMDFVYCSYKNKP